LEGGRFIPDGFANASERLSNYIRHETTHLYYDRGHIDNTIIQQGIPLKENDVYTDDMIKEYQCRFGKPKE